MTLVDYDEMLKRQNGRCAICKTKETKPIKYLCVDHCHKTGAIRGLLCFNCNISIGRLGDDPKILRAAIRYLSKSERNSHKTNSDGLSAPGAS